MQRDDHRPLRHAGRAPRPARAGRGRLRRASLLYWLPVVAWLAVMLTFSSLPDPKHLLGPTTSADEARLHAAGFFVLMLLMTRLTAFWAGRLALRPLLLALAVCAVWAALDEAHQTFIPGRSCNWRDWMTDMAGALLAGLLILAVAGLRPHRTA